MLKRIRNVFRRIFRLKPKVSLEEHERNCDFCQGMKEMAEARRRRFLVPKPGSQAIAKGYGEHMKGKGSKNQLPGYRKSIHARVNPEEQS